MTIKISAGKYQPRSCMKGNIFLYAVFILVLAVITVLLVQFMAGIIPGEKPREGDVIYISQYSFGFAPDYIELTKGETVTLKIKSAGGDHIFAIDQYGIRADVQHTKEVSVRLTADREGEFLFYDPLLGHNESGEHGLLLVKP